MEKVRIRKIIEDIIITQFLNSEMEMPKQQHIWQKQKRKQKLFR